MVFQQVKKQSKPSKEMVFSKEEMQFDQDILEAKNSSKNKVFFKAGKISIYKVRQIFNDANIYQVM